jgi:hypothetical protein
MPSTIRCAPTNWDDPAVVAGVQWTTVKAFQRRAVPARRQPHATQIVHQTEERQFHL